MITACRKCLNPIPAKAFPSNGGGRKSTLCRPCKREYDRDYWAKTKEKRMERKAYNRHKIRKRNKDYVISYLRSHPCVDCGENDPVVLEFDHVSKEETKVESISVMVLEDYGLDKIEKEIAKCVIRCANCHRRKTAKERDYWKLDIA